MQHKTLYFKFFAVYFAILAAVSLWFLPFLLFVPPAYAESGGFIIETIRDSRPLYFERGVPFDFSLIPDCFTVRGTTEEGVFRTRVAYATWNVTDENRTFAENFEPFTVTGEWTEAKDDLNGAETYAVSDQSIAPKAEIRFSDRGAVGAFSVTLRPQRSGMGGNGALIGMSFLLKINGAFQQGAETSFEYSDGRCFTSVPVTVWDYSETLDAFDASVTFFLGDEGVTEELLNSFLNNRYYYRLNVKSGLFQGISNTVTVDSGTTIAPEPPREPDESGVSESNGSADGSRGGGTSFWATPSGTAAGIGIAVAVVVLSIAVGFAVSLFFMKRGKKKHGKKDL